MKPSKVRQDADRKQTLSYSSESLDMLKSKEGQMNAIFACYGSAVQHGQLLEQALGDLILSLHQVSGHSLSRADLRSEEEKIRRKTLGQLLRDFDTHIIKIDRPVQESFRIALKKRNFLIHSYFLERDGGFGRRSGRMKVLRELIAIQNTLERAAIVSRAMLHALTERLEGKARDPDGKVDTLFTFSVDMNQRS